MEKGTAFGDSVHAEREACCGKSRDEIEQRYIEIDQQCAQLGLGEGDELRGRLLGCWFALQNA
jgi:hypothetical protein